MKFNNALNTFHTEFLKFSSQRVAAGQRELRELSQKLTDLESSVRQLCLAVCCPDFKSEGSRLTTSFFLEWKVLEP